MLPPRIDEASGGVGRDQRLDATRRRHAAYTPCEVLLMVAVCALCGIALAIVEQSTHWDVLIWQQALLSGLFVAGAALWINGRRSRAKSIG